MMKAKVRVDVDKDRSGTDRGWQMTMPTTGRHSQVVTSRGTEHLSHESATCHKTDQVSSLRQCRYVVRRWQNSSVRDVERVETSLGSREQSASFRWQPGGELEAYSDADWRGDKATRRSVSAGVTMRRGYCLEVWTKKQQVVSLSSAERELHAVKTASEALGIQSVAKDLAVSCGLNLHLDASAAM